MQEPQKMSRTGIIVEGSLLIALSFILSLIPIFHMPWGGSISLVSTLPLIIMSYRHGLFGGLATSAIYGVLQMVLGLSYVISVPAHTIFAMFMCAMLDYLLAYTVIGFTGFIGKKFKNHLLGLILSILITGFLRYTCSVLSGVFLWGEYSDGWPVWLYSITYNASWLFPDILLTAIAAVPISKIKPLHIFAKN